MQDRCSAGLVCRMLCGAVVTGALFACTPSEQAQPPDHTQIPEQPQVLEKTQVFEPADITPMPPLDLSRKHIVHIIDEQGNAALDEPEPVLKDMFDAASQDKKVTMTGSLITQPEAIDLMDKVDGAEVTLKIKTR